MSNVPHSPLCMCQECQDEALASEIRADADALRTVTAERDALIRDCWEACGGKGPDSSDDELVGTISTMRVGLERYKKALAGQLANQLKQERIFGEVKRKLEAERDALQARIAQLEESALTGYEDGWHALRNERDALKAENAQLRDVLADRDMDREMAARSKLELIEANRQRDALRVRIEGAQVMEVRQAASGKALDLPLPPNLIGKRVALVPLGDDE